MEEFGGKPTPGLGFGLGLDRIMMALEAQQVEFPQLSKCEMYIATMARKPKKKAFLLLGELHRCGIPADTDLCGRGLESPDEVRRQNRRQVHHGAGGITSSNRARLK